MAVVTAGHFDDLVPARVHTHRRIAVITASVPLHTSRSFSIDAKAPTIRAARSVSASVGCTERSALIHRLVNSGQHRRMRVAEDHRAPGAYIIDVFVAIDIEDPGTFGPGDEQGAALDAAERPNRRVDPAGHVSTCLRERLNGFAIAHLVENTQFCLFTRP